jgi:flagellar biosynthesis/type III secretory pathway protein FliH
LNRVIRDAALGAAPVLLDTSAVHFVDGALAEHLAQAEAAAYQRGISEGAAAARADMAAIATRFEAAIRGAMSQAAQLRSEVITESIEAGLAVAEYVTGLPRATDAAALSARIHEAISSLDDERLVIGVNPADWSLVADTIQLPGNVTLESDASLQPGEARVRGTWSSIDMTRRAALAIAREVLS